MISYQHQLAPSGGAAPQAKSAGAQPAPKQADKQQVGAGAGCDAAAAANDDDDDIDVDHLSRQQVLHAIKLEQRHHKDQVECASVLSSLSGHISLMNKQQQQQQAKSCQQQANSTSSGYHSAASSPTSSILSPVSTSCAASPSSSGSPGASSPSATSKQQHQPQHQQQHCSSHSESPTSSTPPAAAAAAKRAEASQACQQPVASSGARGQQQASCQPHLLDYYPETGRDGLRLSWFHEANSRARLADALVAGRMLISGDISLAELSRYPLPIMAKPPLGASDIMLENWLHEVLRLEPQRGVKLTFTSTRTVEPAFRVLARHADRLRGPLVLSADILSWPGQAGAASPSELAKQQQQPVDAWTFLMLCRTRFPSCIISIGWTPSSAQVLEPASLHSSSESMLFELDAPADQQHQNQLVQQQQEAQIAAAVAAAVAASAGAKVNKAASSYHQIGHLSSQLSQHLASSQRLHPYALAGQHRQQHRHAVYNLSQHQHHQHHHTLSSSASLNSSSGNSSGSSSPTSPTGHLLSPRGAAKPSTAGKQQYTASNSSSKQAGAQLDHNQRHQLHHLTQLDEQQQQLQFLHQSGQSAAAAAAIAAAVAAAAAASSSNSQHQPYQQLPLNLNINEAHQQHQQQQHQQQQHQQRPQQLSELAHKIQSYQMISQHQSGACFASGFQQQQAGAKSGPKPAAGAQKQHLLLKTTGQPAASGGYTREMIDKMASVVKEYNLTQPVTFPVEAKLLIRNQQHSLAELQRLLHQVGSNSTLTVVAQQDDLISLDDILTIRKAFGASQVLFDLPEDLASAFRRQLDLV